MKHFKNYFIIGIGCGLGAMLRFFLETKWNLSTSVFPFGTLSANILGTLIIGLTTGVFLKYKNLSPLAKTLITTGFCGGLTTFSSFSLEVVQKIGSDPWYLILCYILLTMLTGLACVFLGLYIILKGKTLEYFTSN
ncbi:fluoride efflux transporter CrcB [Enterococcus sp. LJL98]